MADPIIRVKRSTVAGKIPTTAQLGLGEIAINHFDGKLFIRQDTLGVGIGTTVIVTNPWSVGPGTNTYNTYFTNGNVGIGTTNPTQSLHVQGNARVTGLTTTSNLYVSGVSTFTGSLIPDSTNVILGSPTKSFGGGYFADASYFYGTNKLLISSSTEIGLAAYASNSAYLMSNAGGGSSGNVYMTTILGGQVYAYGAGGVELLHNGSGTTKLQTIGTGITVTGTTFTNQLSVSGVSTFANGPILIGSPTSTGTATQRLQVTGGAYVSGNLGIGVTNPQVPLSIVGNANIVGVITATTFSGNLTGNVTGNLNSSGVNTATTLSGTTATYATGNFTTGNIVTGIVTTISGTQSTYTNATIGVGTVTTLNYGTVAGISTTITTVATTSATTIDSFSATVFRSARVQVQITQGTNYQASDILIIHDGASAFIVEYGSIATGNSYLGNFTAAVSAGNCLLQINMSSATSATVKVLSQRITI